MKKIIFLFYISIVSNSLNAQIAEIPFYLENDGSILIKVKINDNFETHNFLFDTGATSDVLDTSIAKNLGLKANYKQDVSGAGGNRFYDVILSQKLTLKNIDINNTNLVLSDLSQLNDTSEGSINIDGIIGYSLLQKFVTKIDYDNRKLLLYDKIDHTNTADYKAIHFEFGNGIPIPQFDITITLKNGESFTGKVLFDSGAALSLLINRPFNEKNQLKAKAGKSLFSTSENLHGESSLEHIAIRSMNFGGYNLEKMVVGIAHDKSGVSSYKSYLGIVGSLIISRFNLILDYSSSVLYIKPNNRFREPFEFPVSGIKLKKNNGDIIIKSVEESSSAYKKGIRKGDQLTSINTNSSGDIKAYRDLLKKENSEVDLTIIDSKGKRKKVRLKLKRLL